MSRGFIFAAGGTGILGFALLTMKAWPWLQSASKGLPGWAMIAMTLVEVAVPLAIVIKTIRRRRQPLGAAVDDAKVMEMATSNVGQYQNWVTQQLERLIYEQQIHVRARVNRGPFSLNYVLTITQSPRDGLHTLLGLEATMKMILRTNVRLIQAPEGVRVEVQLPKGATITPNAAKLAKVARWPQLPLGIDQDMRPVIVNPQEHGAMYWIAPPRAGKTQSMRATLYLALRSTFNVEFIVCALPTKIRQDWGAFGNAEGCLGLVGDPAQMVTALQWTVDRMAKTQAKGPTLIILDDLTVLMTMAPEMQPMIDALALTGPGLGYHLMVGTHGAGSIATTGGKMAQFATTCKVLFKAADNNTGSRSSGRKNSETGLASLSGMPGDAIFDESGNIRRIATAWVKDTEVMTLPQAAAGMSRPWAQVVTPAVTKGDMSQGGHSRRDKGVTSGRGDLSRLSQPSHPIDPPLNAAPRTATRDEARGGADDAVTPVTPVTTVTRDQLIADVADIFPLDRERDLRAREQLALLRLDESGLFSTSALADVVYGKRNTRRVAKIRAILDSIIVEDHSQVTDNAPAAAPEPPELTEDEAINILQNGGADHPLRQLAFNTLKIQSINGYGWNERGQQGKGKVAVV